MADIAAIQMKLDTRPLERGNKKLDQFGQKATKAGNDALGMGKSASRIFEQLEKDMTIIENKSHVFDGFDVNTQKIYAVEEALNDLLNQGVHPNSEAVEMLRMEYEKLAGSGRALTGNIGRTNMAVMNFGRIIQDAPFGMMGVANNIDPFIQSFSRMRAEVGSTGGALKQLIMGTITGPTGLMFLLGSAMPTALLLLNKHFQSNKNQVEEVDESYKKFQSTLDQIINREFDEFMGSTEDLEDQISQVNAALDRLREPQRAAAFEQQAKNLGLMSSAGMTFNKTLQDSIDLNEQFNQSMFAQSDATSNQAVQMGMLNEALEEAEKMESDIRDRVKEILEDKRAQLETEKLILEVLDETNALVEEASGRKFEHGGVRVPVSIPEDQILSDLDAVFQELDVIINQHDLSVPDKMFPPGSVGGLQQDIRELQQELLYLTDPQEIQLFLQEIDRLNGKIEQLTQTTHGGVDAMGVAFQVLGDEIPNTVGRALDDLLIKGESLQDVFGNLLREIHAALVQALIIQPIVQGLKAGLTGGASSLFGFSQGAAFEYAQGGAFTNNIVDEPTSFHNSVMGEAGPEAIVPLKRMSSGNLGIESSGSTKQSPVNVVINNHSGAEVETRERQTTNGREIEVVIGKVVQGMFNSGKIDKHMAANFGVSRKGVNRG